MSAPSTSNIVYQPPSSSVYAPTDRGNIFLFLILGIIIVLALFFFVAYLIQIFWNWSITKTFGSPSMSYWAAVSLVVLIFLIGTIFSVAGVVGSRPWSSK